MFQYCNLSPSTMSFKLSKPLNPEAEEWRPTKTLRCDRIMYTLQSQPAAGSAPPPPQMAYPADMAAYYGYVNYYSAYFDQRVQYFRPPSSLPISSPANNGFCEKVSKPFFNGDKEIDGKQVEKVDVMKEDARTNCPPRFRKHGRPFYFVKKSQPKLDWWPRKLARSKTEIPCAGRGVVDSQSLSSAPLTRDNVLSPSKTTVMIKNIPNQLRRDYMLNFLDRYCSEFSLEYDFLYLPMDFRKEDNLGYGFVNFTTPVAAMKFMQILQNFKWDGFQTERGSFTSKKICQITWAKIQGKEGYVKRFRHYNFACDQLEFLPVLLDPPRNGSDPNPHPPVILGNLMPPRFLKKNQFLMPSEICGSLG